MLKNKINKSRKNQNGITLIALVVTIVVLLILAGITISMFSKDNGILNNAQKASLVTKVKQVEDEANSIYESKLINNSSKGKNVKSNMDKKWR